MKRKFIKSAMLVAALLVISILLIGLLNYNKQLSGRQNILKMVYPLLMKTGKWFGIKQTTLNNTDVVTPPQPIYSLGIELNNGNKIMLDQFRGNKILIVNTASDCGYTKQYESLQQLYDQFRGKLVIIGFPANDFKEQEKGTDKEIAEFCKANFGINFPLVKKTKVIKGAGQHPVFQWLSQHDLNGWCDQAPEWNFSKYLINEKGILTNYFSTAISPLDPVVTAAVEQ
jgi:glutathione peroxidase